MRAAGTLRSDLALGGGPDNHRLLFCNIIY